MTRLPDDILELICGIIRQEASEPDVHSFIKFLPHSDFLPLLRVCKSWYPIAERHLYTSIAAGSRFQPHLPMVEGETLQERRNRIRMILSTQPKRLGWQIVDELFAVLKGNQRLAGIVKELRLGVMSIDFKSDPEWTEKNMQVLRLCPNVEQVEIRGIHVSKFDVVFNALKEKSLVTLTINPNNLTHDGGGGGTARQLLDAMQAWPRLKSLKALAMLGVREVTTSTTIANYCPDLRTFIFDGDDLQENEIRLLGIICPNISRLRVPIRGMAFPAFQQVDKSLDTLCECLHAWSPTLECFRLNVRYFVPVHAPFTKALSRLSALRELHVERMAVDLACLSALSNLERLYLCLSSGEEIQLAEMLEDATKFPALKSLSIRMLTGENGNKFKDVCSRREISIHDWKGTNRGFIL